MSGRPGERLDIIPATVRVLRYVRKTDARHACEGEIKTAPQPAQAIPKSLASPGTLAHVAVTKSGAGPRQTSGCSAQP